ncbi:DoxX family protein [Patescibacteria group bacterium]|nr:DoxX family protein [Patescibacteria group bacterium]
MRKKLLGWFYIALALFGLTPLAMAFAHEAYVLPANEFHAGLKVFSQHPFAPLLDPAHFKLSVIITICVVSAYALNFLWAATKPAAAIDRFLKKASPVGPLIIRLTVGFSFFYSALSAVSFGPELQLSYIHAAHFIQYVEFVIALMFIFGIFTEVAALIGAAIFAYLIFFFHGYMITYTNYFGEFLALIFFGSRFLSFDRLAFGKMPWLRKMEKFKDLEVPLVRILYGVALIYAGYTIKFAHQELTVAVYNQYHLENFFHNSAAFIAAGAGLSELAIGFFILIGLATRLTVITSLVFITLSLSYFHELLWPHFLLYGISISLIINSAGRYSVDSALVPWVRRHILRRPA